jgi:hypothetical protein
MAQKVVLVVAAGVVLVVVGFALRAWFWTSGPGGGWFNYAPSNGVMFTYDSPAKGPILGQAAAWIGLVVVWTLGALALFRSPRAAPVHGAAEGPV